MEPHLLRLSCCSRKALGESKKEITMAGKKAAIATTDVTHPTGKYTLNGWGQTEADFAFFDLAQDKVELKSDGWRTKKIADNPKAYEWWYFHIPNHDGTVITGMLSAQPAIGRTPRLST